MEINFWECRQFHLEVLGEKNATSVLFSSPSPLRDPPCQRKTCSFILSSDPYNESCSLEFEFQLTLHYIYSEAVTIWNHPTEVSSTDGRALKINPRWFEFDSLIGTELFYCTNLALAEEI